MTFVSIHDYSSGCSQPGSLGMEGGAIADSQITSSSFYRGTMRDLSAWEGRLNGDRCWRSSEQNSNDEWFQVDFLYIVTITAIQIQGCITFQLNKYFVTKLQVAIGNSQDSLVFIKDDDGSVKVSGKQHLAFVLKIRLYLLLSNYFGS